MNASFGLPPTHGMQRRGSVYNNLIIPYQDSENKKTAQKKLERGIKKSIAASEISNLFQRYSLRGMMRGFHKWKSLMQQEQIVERFEVEGGVRTHQEIFVHNTLLKATRNIFR